MLNEVQGAAGLQDRASELFDLLERIVQHKLNETALTF
jgi:hypothetical protein